MNALREFVKKVSRNSDTKELARIDESIWYLLAAPSGRCLCSFPRAGSIAYLSVACKSNGERNVSASVICCFRLCAVLIRAALAPFVKHCTLRPTWDRIGYCPPCGTASLQFYEQRDLFFTPPSDAMALTAAFQGFDLPQSCVHGTDCAIQNGRDFCDSVT